MESVIAFPDGEWDRLFSTEDIDFEQQVLHQFSFPDSDGLSFINSSSFCPITDASMTDISGVDESFLYSSNGVHSTSFHYNSQESSQSSNGSGGAFVSPPNHESYYLSANHVAVTNDINMPLNISMDHKITGLFSSAFPSISMEDTTLSLIEDLSLGKLDDTLQPPAVPNLVLPEELPLPGMINTNKRKRPRVPKDASKDYKNVQSKKKCKINEGENKFASDGHSCSTYSSDEENVSQDGVANSDSKASQALNLNGKARANRGSATDPQSLYARKRRERINERLRILQNLVPNGTKVDISTMLEEAVHYVKFLQLQIKLLSSDDLWMYAPIAYNGVDICLNQKISTLL